MEYSFDIEFAKKYGVDEAIMIKSFQYWIRLNKANKSNYHDGRFWTYNTTKALAELFPFWSEKQVRAILSSLLIKDILIKGNYNKLGFDRTIWYAFKDEKTFIDAHSTKWANATDQMGKSKIPNGQMEFTKWANATDQMGGTIPVTNTYTNTDTNSIKEELVDFKKSNHPSDLFEEIEFEEEKPKQKMKEKNPEDAKYYFEFYQVISRLTELTGAKYRIPETMTKFLSYKPYTLLKALFDDGNDYEIINRIVEAKCAEWLSDAKMCAYLVPDTLFRKSNFEKYLAAIQIRTTNGNHGTNSINKASDKLRAFIEAGSKFTM